MWNSRKRTAAAPRPPADDRADPEVGPRAGRRAGLADLAQALTGALDLITEIRERTTTVVDYDEVIGWFVQMRPTDGSAQRGAVLRFPGRGRRTEIVQVFLDAENGIVCAPNGRPIGRRLIVDRLDEELTELFASSDLVVVE